MERLFFEKIPLYSDGSIPWTDCLSKNNHHSQDLDKMQTSPEDFFRGKKEEKVTYRVSTSWLYIYIYINIYI